MRTHLVSFKTTFYTLIFTLITIHFGIAQVGIGNVNPQASLDVSASSTTAPINTDGLLVPRMNTFPGTDPGAFQNSMLVYLTTNVTIGTVSYTKGYHYWDNDIPAWVPLSGAKRINDLIDGKSDVDGTEDGASVYLGLTSGNADDSSDNQNVGVGFQSLALNTTGDQNVAIGHTALSLNVDGRRNTGLGSRALNSNSDGGNNTALGVQALQSNTSGNHNLAIGALALAENNANRNLGIGNQSFRYNETGEFNVGLGYYSGRVAKGNNNTYIGARAGNSDGSASSNKVLW
ncbi:hypothetical protein [Lacinutrix salivirga]